MIKVAAISLKPSKSPANSCGTAAATCLGGFVAATSILRMVMGYTPPMFATSSFATIIDLADMCCLYDGSVRQILFLRVIGMAPFENSRI
jgi:hypothetical protein